MLLAERVATYKGVRYCARGAITSPSDYERTKGYIKRAFQNQIDGSGLGFVEILCACFAQAYRSPYETLKWIHDEVTQEWPLGELRRGAVLEQRKRLSSETGGT
jgi:2-oxoglutarate ferredoxin oxidoreductase subunit beta